MMLKYIFLFNQGHTAIRSKFKLKIQAEAHQKNVKTKNKITMKRKRDIAIRNEKKREPKVCIVNFNIYIIHIIHFINIVWLHFR